MNDLNFSFACPQISSRVQASYAANPLLSKGRLLFEPLCPNRTEFQRDRDRIIHSRAFRRLKHKTQVFIASEGDHYRTRLTHSLEVAQISRTLARSLGVNEDLAETIALAHDLGHPPFGHAGESALNIMMENYGGFDHNAQTLRVLTQLEHLYAAYDGLNLTWETLEGIVKHNGPILDVIEPSIASFNSIFPLQLDSFASLEAQIAAISDDIAYCTHDFDDGLRAQILKLEHIENMPIVSDLWAEVINLYPFATMSQKIFETTRKLIGVLVDDVRNNTILHLKAATPNSVDEIRESNKVICNFSHEMQLKVREFKSYMLVHVYNSPEVMQVMSDAQEKLQSLFASFMNNPTLLPQEWQARISPENQLPRIVCDYIAGMTDLYAIKMVRELYSEFN